MSVEYRLAPDHPDPAPVEDCYAGLVWMAKNADELGIDTCSAEGFRDEILIYAGRLSEAGVSVDFHMWGGGFHGSDMSVGDAAVSRASNATREEFIRRALDR